MLRATRAARPLEAMTDELLLVAEVADEPPPAEVPADELPLVEASSLGEPLLRAVVGEDEPLLAGVAQVDEPPLAEVAADELPWVEAVLLGAARLRAMAVKDELLLLVEVGDELLREVATSGVLLLAAMLADVPLRAERSGDELPPEMGRWVEPL